LVFGYKAISRSVKARGPRVIQKPAATPRALPQTFSRNPAIRQPAQSLVCLSVHETIAKPRKNRQLCPMLATLVMTLISPDRPGLVELVAARVAEHGGNWLESRMCRLGGQFAGIVRVEVPVERVDALSSALRSLQGQGVSLTSQVENLASAKVAGTLALLELVGQDRPGILHQITRVLAAHAVNVEELSSERVSAPIDGNMLFQARATVLLPPAVSIAALRSDLEQIASDLMVDVELKPR
jgi:glycine cleavage system regulatory protein